MFKLFFTGKVKTVDIAVFFLIIKSSISDLIQVNTEIKVLAWLFS